jgi:hypothetical protein
MTLIALTSVDGRAVYEGVANRSVVSDTPTLIVG